MEKPIKPIEPRFFDYPREEGLANEKTPYVMAYRKYEKDLKKYEEKIFMYLQTQMILDIQRSTLKLCLKKYQIIKK